MAKTTENLNHESLTMKAVVYNKYGDPDVLEVRNIAKPIPKNKQLLIKIKASTVTPSDILLRTGKFPWLFWLPIRIYYGFFKPRNQTPGYEFSGVVEAIGTNVTQYKIGNQVMGATMWRMSCNAEYICIPESSAIIEKPHKMTFQDAAAFSDGFCTALHFLKKAEVKAKDQVLIYGASGSVGTASVQLAKYFGAEVTAVCSTNNIGLVESIGADKVVDYTIGNFSKQLDQKYDVIFDTVGKASYKDCISSLKHQGLYISTVMSLSKRLRGILEKLKNGKRVKGGFSTTNSKDLAYLIKIYSEGNLRPIIDRVYHINDIIKAHEYVGSGHKRGNVVLSIEELI